MQIHFPSLLSTDISGSIQLTNEATASLIARLSSSLDNRYILSGSVSQADWNTLENRPSNVISSSTDSTTVDFTITNGNITANLIGGVVSGSSQVVGILDSLNSYTSSNDTTNTTQNSRLDQLSTVSESAIGRLNSIESFTSSINTTIKTELNSNTVISGSSQVYFSCISEIPTDLLSGSVTIQTSGSTIYSTNPLVGIEFPTNNSILLGFNSACNNTISCHSTFIGYNVGSCNIFTKLCRNNIIIGTNITLPNNRLDSINLGGIIFATGSHFSTTGNPLSGSVINGRVGINIVEPKYQLEVSGSFCAGRMILPVGTDLWTTTS
jgi:hypothetical protein